MDLFNFITGLVVLTLFGWIFLRNIKRKGFLHAYLRLETVTGMIVGLYLIITAFL